MKHIFHTLLVLLFATGMGFTSSAQVNGTAVAPAVSTAANPVYYFIESASDGSFSFNNFTGDFRGNVLISPATAGKIIHNKLSTAPSQDHALWQLIVVDNVRVLKNKATGMYMTGSHSTGTTATGNEFNFEVIAGKQYSIRNGTMSYTNTWQNNLCDRINTGIQANSLVAWYFISPSPLGATIASATSILSTTRAGVHPGQYTTSNRNLLQQAIYTAIAARDNTTTDDDEQARITLEAAISTYQNTQNTIRVSNEQEEFWYWIKSTRGSSNTALFAENTGTGTQVVNKDRAIKDAQLWKVVVSGEGYALVNKQGAVYLNTDVAYNALLTTVATKPAKAVYFNKSVYATDNTDFIQYFLVEDTRISASAAFRMHAGSTSHNYGLMNWNGGIADNSSFQFLLYDPTDLLNVAIMAHEEVYARSPRGTNPGTYPAAAHTAYRSAIDAAKAISNNEASTTEEKNAATLALDTAKTTFLESRNPIKRSTSGAEVWYYIVSAGPTYCNGQVITNQSNTAGTALTFGTKALDSNKIWKFTDAGNGKMTIQNMASSLYIAANPGTSGSSATPAAFTATWLAADAQFLFNADGQVYLHAQQSGSKLVTWSTNTLNSASAWKLEEIPASETTRPLRISSVTVNQGTYTTTSIGATDHGLANITLKTDGIVGTVHLKSVTIDLNGTTRAAAVKSLKLYHTGSSTRLNPATHTLLAQTDNPSTTSSTLKLELATPYQLPAGTIQLYVAADIAAGAQEGDIIDTRVHSIDYSYLAGTDTVARPATIATPLQSIVFLKRVQVLTPGDYNSVSYRIPAITTAADGSLVVLTDKRKYHSGDLPADIDVVANRSTDGGATWSKPITVAQGTGGSSGFGDAAIVKAKSGRLIALCVGGPGLFSSTPENPIRSYMATCDDHGVTWTSPRDITPLIYGAQCTDPVRAKWQGSFFGSGHALCLRSGRIMAVIAVREPNMSGLQNYAVYSDDEGASWNVSQRAIIGGDEAKVVELDNGDILMSSRTGGNRLWAKSSDGGISWGTKNNWSQIWGNACDADIIRYTSVKDGYNRSRLLHTLPNASDRRNLSMWISYDEGTSWNTRKTICAGTAAYSSFTILPNGNIGVYFEEDGSNAYTMTFVEFTLKWLTSGADTYEPPVTSVQEVPDELKLKIADRKIEVEGASSFRIFTVGGVETARDKPLANGVYIVTVPGQGVRKVVIR